MVCINAIDDSDGSDKVYVVEDGIMNEDNDSGYDELGKGCSFDKDMLAIIDITKREIELYRHPNVGKKQHGDDDNDFDDEMFHWISPTSVHPHMMLEYPFDDVVSDSHSIKKLVTESHAYCNELMLRYDSNNDRLEIFRKDFGYYSNVVERAHFARIMAVSEKHVQILVRIDIMNTTSNVRILVLQLILVKTMSPILHFCT